MAERARSRLLIVTPDFPPAHGGVQELVYRLALSLSGYQVEVVTLAAPRADAFDRESLLRTTRVAAGVPGAVARMLALNAAAVARALSYRPEAVLNAHLITSPAAAAIRRLLGTRTLQYFYANEIAGRPRLAAYAARHADRVVAISRYTASLLAATGADAAEVRVIPPGVELPSDRDLVSLDRPVVVTVAQLKHSYKGHDVLIRALARVRERVPNVEWVVIGDGPLRPELEGLACAAGLGRAARFLGLVPDAERDDWLRRATVLAMPSRRPQGRLGGEGFGIAYLEAGAHGKPVIAGDAAGSREAVVDGVTGLLIDPVDPAALADALVRVLTDRDLATRLGAAGRRHAGEHAWPAIARRVEAALAPQTAAA